MVKRIISLLLLLFALLPVACDKPREVPDEQLAMIFHDAMLVNAYINYNIDFKADSLNIYEPIFARYGYTTEDVQYTINNFSRRKSIRLSDVAEYMINLLEEESKQLGKEVARTDTINNVALRRATRTILADTAIVATKAADSTLLRIVVDDIRAGEYSVKGSYTLDSLDKDNNRRLRIYFEREDSTQHQLLNGSLMRRGVGKFNQSYLVDSKNTTYRRLVIDFYQAAFDTRPKSVPKITIHDVEVQYTPPVDESVRRLFNEQSQMRIFSDTLIRAIEARAKE